MLQRQKDVPGDGERVGECVKKVMWEEGVSSEGDEEREEVMRRDERKKSDDLLLPFLKKTPEAISLKKMNKNQAWLVFD